MFDPQGGRGEGGREGGSEGGSTRTHVIQEATALPIITTGLKEGGREGGREGGNVP